jgi:chromate transport protein ChrA
VLGRSAVEVVVNGVALAIIVVALTLGWRSGGEVVRANRPWTRAWWMSLSALQVWVGGYVIPIGAAYVVVRYLRRGHSLNRRRPVARPSFSSVLPASSADTTAASDPNVS